jgi:hypothetical protein
MHVVELERRRVAGFLHKEMGFVMIVINGERKEILVPGETPIDLRAYLTITKGNAPEEFNSQLAKLYTENNWERYPLGITGCLCVERGVTFQCGPQAGVHDGFLFDYAVIPPIASKPEAYQTMARTFGNVGHLPNYKPVEIYTSSAMFKKVEKQEEMAVNTCSIVFERKLEMVNEKILKDAQNLQTEKLWDLHTGEFSSLNELNEWQRSLGLRQTRPSGVEENEYGSFYTSSTSKSPEILKYYKVKAMLARSGKLSFLDVGSGPVYGRMFVCYKIRNDPKSVVFIGRAVTRKL